MDILLPKAINESLGDKKGINRYGFFYIPMDECLSRSVIDFCGRPELNLESSSLE